MDFNTEVYFTLGSEEQGALPIELIAFEANKTIENKVKLEWATASESDNSYFTIERSKTGSDFEAIGTIEGAGSSSQIRNYQYIDFEATAGQQFYRLKQTDFNGNFEYSAVRSINIKNENVDLFQVSPNPASQGKQIKINYNIAEDKETLIQIMSPNGQLLWEKTHWLDASNNHMRLSSDRLVKGLNLIRIHTGGNESKVLKLIVH